MGIEEGGDLRVGEGFPLHDGAPVTTGVADGQKNRLVLGPGFLQGLRDPRPPIHRILGVLAQVKAGTRGEAIGHRYTLSPFLLQASASSSQGGANPLLFKIH
jgi:hypothetical protein